MKYDKLRRFIANQLLLIYKSGHVGIIAVVHPLPRRGKPIPDIRIGICADRQAFIKLNRLVIRLPSKMFCNRLSTSTIESSVK